MNYMQDTTVASQPIARPLVGFLPESSRSKNIIFRISIFLSASTALFLVLLLKSKTTVDFHTEPYFFTYAIFVTTFELSRIASAMLYKSSFRSLLTEKNFPKDGDFEPKVAFIIPCKNEEKDIIETIWQCFNVDYPEEKIEVIVINDGSTDGTIEVLKNLKMIYPNIRIFDWPKNQGKRWGMAAGFSSSNSEIVIQLDSDSYVDPKSLRDLVAPFKNPSVGAVCANGEPKNSNTNIITKMQAAYYFMSFKILKAAESSYDTVFCCSGCCSAYRKSAVMPILFEWLGEKFLGKSVTWGDDRALTSWLLKTGWKTVYADKARAYTVVPETFKKLLIQQLRWKKSWIVNFFITIRFIIKKQPFVTFFYYIPLVFISFLAPIMTIRALIYAPIVNGIMPLYHIAGVLLLTAIFAIYYRFLDRNNKYWPYLFLWSIFTFFVLSFMLIWAAIRIQDRGWGTR